MKLRMFLSVIVILAIQALCAQSEQVLLRDLATARQEHKLISQTNLLIKLADLAIKQKDTAAALKYYDEAYEVCVQRHHWQDQIFVASHLAEVYSSSGALDKALQWYLTALEITRKHGDPNRESMLHNNLGIIYLNIGSYDKSLEHYITALELKKKAGDKTGIANALTNMAVYYIRTENYQTALQYQKQALEIRQTLGEQSMVAATYNAIAVTHRHLGNIQEAFRYLNMALDIYLRLGNTAKIASCYNNMGVQYLFMNDLPRAKEYYLMSYELKKDSSDAYSVLSTLNNLADISLKLQQFNDAKKYLDLAKPYLEINQYLDLSKSLNKLYSEYYEAMGNSKQALEYFKAYHAANDSLFNVQKQNQLNEMEVKYEVLQKEKHIELLTRNNELSKRNLIKSRQLRNYLIIIITLIIALGLVLIRRYRETVRLNRHISSHREELRNLNQDLEKRVQTEVAIRQEHEQKALQQSRLAILGELAAGIAHELNQPLQTLSLTIENILFALQDEPSGVDVLEKKMSYLFEDISRMQSVIEHIRRFSKQSGDQSQSSFALRECIDSAIALVRDRFAQCHISLQCHYPETAIYITGNQYKFEHVIINLLTNAKDAILDKRGDATPGTDEIRIEVVLKKLGVCIHVHDQGCGIAAEHQDTVFDSFFSTKPIEKGTGLGLAIAKGIIGNMNGSIGIDSQQHIGTTVTISLPIEPESSV
jgi:signal transduction histidine kinase